MTLGIVLSAKDNSIVIVSDKRVTGGTISMSAHGDFVEKIHKVTDRCGLTIAGDAGTAVTIIELFLKEIKLELTRKTSKEVPITEAAEIFRQVAVDYYTKWFKDMTMREWVQNVKDGVIPYFRVLMAGYDIGEDGNLSEGKIIEISSVKRFAPDIVTAKFGVIGVTTIAQYLLYRFYMENRDEASAVGLAAFCIKETSSQDDSVGDQFQVATFSKDKPFQFYSDSQLDKINKRCAELKTEFQLALLSPQKVREETKPIEIEIKSLHSPNQKRQNIKK